MGLITNNSRSYTKTQAVTPLAVAYASTINLNLSERSNFVIAQLTGNATLTFSNPVPGSGGVIEVTQDAVGSRLLTLSGANILKVGGLSPALSTTPLAKDRLSYYVDSNGKVNMNLGMKGMEA